MTVMDNDNDQQIPVHTSLHYDGALLPITCGKLLIADRRGWGDQSYKRLLGKDFACLAVLNTVSDPHGYMSATLHPHSNNGHLKSPSSKL
eukprot:26254-Amphidinium_carterae.1